MPYAVGETQAYATPADLLTYGMSAQALASPATPPSVQTAAILGASAKIDGALRQQFKLPLVQWGPDIVRICCQLASYDLIAIRGFNPDGEADQNFLERYKLAQQDLLRIAQGLWTPDVVDSKSGAVEGQNLPSSAPAAYSSAPLNSTGTQLRGVDARMGTRRQR